MIERLIHQRVGGTTGLISNQNHNNNYKITMPIDNHSLIALQDAISQEDKAKDY